MLTKKETPIACDLTVFTNEERRSHISHSEKVLDHAKGFLEKEEGFELYFDHSLSAEELTEWFSKEHQCCPFLEFKLEKNQDGHTIRISSSKEGINFFRSAFLSRKKENIGIPTKAKSFAKLSVLFAGILCLSCLAPLLFGWFSAEVLGNLLDLERYMVPVIGVAIAGIWFWFSFKKKNKEVQKSSGCGC
ncbi:hypothetical protein EHQ81_13665 [Leptospira selangorensis]|uniref:Uncharacterized protein n=1 Tax=Leptospira selangorensis TaxID=2484982 RepID=A0A5F2BXP7_9LEPT|nr:hypothetical protein [Leptospira selangorensis]TGM12119.1 hypothetical protein EHQ81_13665 [Leptospira selangorensis]TGM14838.1 hypothetical protein EHQ82_18945 [Leptospira selangorensis]